MSLSKHASTYQLTSLDSLSLYSECAYSLKSLPLGHVTCNYCPCTVVCQLAKRVCWCVGDGRRDTRCSELLEARGLRHCVVLPLGQLTLLLVSIVCAGHGLQRGRTPVSQPGMHLMPRLAYQQFTGRKGEASQQLGVG